MFGFQPNDPPHLSAGAQDLAREVIDYILNAPHGLNPFPQSAFYQLVEQDAMANGLPKAVGSDVASGMGEWLQTQGYITLTSGAPQSEICDCPECCRVIAVTPSGVLFAAERSTPPWEASSGSDAIDEIGNDFLDSMDPENK
jgi:hypothetical protein